MLPCNLHDLSFLMCVCAVCFSRITNCNVVLLFVAGVLLPHRNAQIFTNNVPAMDVKSMCLEIWSVL